MNVVDVTVTTVEMLGSESLAYVRAPVDIVYGADRHWTCGDRGVSEWTFTGTARDGTRVEVNGVDMTAVKAATKGKKVNRRDMIQSIDKVLKNWGSYGKNMVWNFVI